VRLEPRAAGVLERGAERRRVGEPIVRVLRERIFQGSPPRKA